jgi:hypothetical protein
MELMELMTASPPHVCHVEGGRGGIDNVLNAGDSLNGNEEMGAEQRIVVQLQTAWLGGDSNSINNAKSKNGKGALCCSDTSL